MPSHAFDRLLSMRSPRSKYSWSVPRDGRWWLLVAAVLWATGIAKGINLIALLGSILLATWLLNAVAARRRLRGLHARRWIEDPVFAGISACVTIEVGRPRGHLREGIAVRDHGDNHEIVQALPERASLQRWRTEHLVTVPRRGVYHWQPLELVSAYPFGLVSAKASFGRGEKVIALPRLGRIHLARFRRLVRQASGIDDVSSERPTPEAGHHGEFYGVREFREGDSPRWIHWRTSARQGQLMVREFEEEPCAHFIIILDAWQSKPDEREPEFEAAISLTATLCWELSRRAGSRVALGIAGEQATLRWGSAVREPAHEILEALAVEQGSPQPDRSGLLNTLLATRLPRGPIVLISTQTSPFGAKLRQLRRSVLEIDLANSLDFYERPADAR